MGGSPECQSLGWLRQPRAQSFAEAPASHVPGDKPSPEDWEGCDWQSPHRTNVLRVPHSPSSPHTYCGNTSFVYSLCFHIDKYRSVPQASFFLGSCIQHLCYSQRAPPLTSLPWQLALHCPAHHQMPKVRPSNWNPLFLSMKIPCYIQTPYYTQDGSEQAEDIELYLLQLWMNTFKSIVRHSIQWKDSSGRRW